MSDLQTENIIGTVRTASNEFRKEFEKIIKSRNKIINPLIVVCIVISLTCIFLTISNGFRIHCIFSLFFYFIAWIVLCHFGSDGMPNAIQIERMIEKIIQNILQNDELLLSKSKEVEKLNERILAARDAYNHEERAVDTMRQVCRENNEMVDKKIKELKTLNEIIDSPHEYIKKQEKIIDELKEKNLRVEIEKSNMIAQNESERNRSFYHYEKLIEKFSGIHEEKSGIYNEYKKYMQKFVHCGMEDKIDMYSVAIRINLRK